jgi:hypothetical protein
MKSLPTGSKFYGIRPLIAEFHCTLRIIVFIVILLVTSEPKKTVISTLGNEKKQLIDTIDTTGTFYLFFKTYLPRNKEIRKEDQKRRLEKFAIRTENKLEILLGILFCNRCSY